MAERVDVLVCRGCCCGTAKHPEVDHDAHLAAVRAAVDARPDAHLKVVDCLGPCSDSNVVAVRQRRPGQRPLGVWLGGLLADADVAALGGWLRDGGARPSALDERVFLGPTAWPDLDRLEVTSS